MRRSPTREDDAITQPDPETQGSDVAAETEDQANEPARLAGTWLMVRDLWRILRGEDDRSRKVRWMLKLLKPYRTQVILMAIALLIAGVCALASDEPARAHAPFATAQRLGLIS